MSGEQSTHIQLKVRDQHGTEVQFKIKRAAKLNKLMEAYCQRIGNQMAAVRFMMDGERINPDDTAEALGLDDEDMIDVAVEQTGGCCGERSVMTDSRPAHGC